MMDGEKIYKIAEELFPICRSITGEGVRSTFQILRKYVPDLQTYEVPTGTTVFDWTIPKEWKIRAAYIENSKGEKVIDFAKNNLHVLGYSAPMDAYLPLDEMKKIVYTQKEQPEVIPYVTSYYKERSGFCMSQNQLDNLPEDVYHCVIDSELFEGSLTYGELILPGKSQKEILFSTYICHPSMANNECSGPSLAVGLIDYIKNMENREFTYRFVFIPETIGSLTYLSKNCETMKENTYAGFNLSCVGDDREYSFVATRYGDTVTDEVLRHVLKKHAPHYVEYSYLERGSDERQYNSPRVNLPVCGFSRTKFGKYPEYHTSADDMTVISPQGFAGALDIMQKCVRVLEHNHYYEMKVFGEPQLGKRGLYPTISQKGSYDAIQDMMNFMAYADGKNSLLEIAERIGADALNLIPIAQKLLDNGLVMYEK